MTPTGALGPYEIVVAGEELRQASSRLSVVGDVGEGVAVVRKGRKVWTVAQLRTFLQRSRSDRFFALWVLEATSGMRRCELAGAHRDLLDLDAGTLTIEVTRVVVDGRVIESDGKTENAQHVLALDPFTLAVLKVHTAMLDTERAEFGPDYHDHGLLFCWENGTPPHPDTITRRFHRLGAAAGLPKINLHGVRHSYATAGRDAKIDWKALSQRIGHADVAFTMKQYVQTDLEADRCAGCTGSEPRALVLRWNGTAWKRVPSPTRAGASELYGVTATSARNAWAVGAAGATGTSTPSSLILRWNGIAWTRVASPAPPGGAGLFAGGGNVGAQRVGRRRHRQPLRKPGQRPDTALERYSLDVTG
jgi:hypothetical protein